MNEYLKVGKIIGNRGLKGELKIKSFCDSLEDFCKIKNLYLSPDNLLPSVEYFHVYKNLVLIKIHSVNNVEESMDLIGKNLYAKRKDIPLEDGRYFIEDIIGLEVFDIDTQEVYGSVINIIKTGANDVYCIKDHLDREYFLPVIKDIVIRIDLINKKIWIRPIKGIFND